MRLRIAGSSYHLCRYESCPGRRRRFTSEEALPFLRNCLSDPVFVHQLRRLLFELDGHAVDRLSDHGVLDAALQLIRQRRLCFCEEGAQLAERQLGGPVAGDIEGAPPPATSAPILRVASEPLPSVFQVPVETGKLAQQAAAEGSPFIPLERQKVLTWIECELVGEDGEPVPGIHYTIRLPDGSEREGYTDSFGRLRYDGIDPGTCAFSFDLLDQDAWVPLGQLAARSGGGD